MGSSFFTLKDRMVRTLSVKCIVSAYLASFLYFIFSFPNALAKSDVQFATVNLLIRTQHDVVTYSAKHVWKCGWTFIIAAQSVSAFYVNYQTFYISVCTCEPSKEQ